MDHHPLVSSILTLLFMIYWNLETVIYFNEPDAIEVFEKVYMLLIESTIILKQIPVNNFDDYLF